MIDDMIESLAQLQSHAALRQLTNKPATLRHRKSAPDLASSIGGPAEGDRAVAGAILAIVFGALLAPLFVVGFVRNIVPLVRVSRYGASAAGTIVGFTRQRLQYRTVDRLIVRFTTVNGRSVEFTDPMAQRAGLRRGDSVTVHYSPIDRKAPRPSPIPDGR